MYHNDLLRRFLDGVDERNRVAARIRAWPAAGPADRAAAAGAVTSTSSPTSTSRTSRRTWANFLRVFFREEDHLELAPRSCGAWPSATRRRSSTRSQYSHRPTGVFHALPISRGKSIVNSHWIKDMIGFYGLEIFLAETSATCGGLDSLLEPTGPLRDGPGAGRARPSAPGRPTSSPTAPRPPTRSSARRWCSPATSCWSTATATSPTTTG